MAELRVDTVVDGDEAVESVFSAELRLRHCELLEQELAI